MKAELGWVWAADEPPGSYSTSTPLMLLPGTLGSTWSYTSVTLDLSSEASLADAAVKETAASAAAQRNRLSMDGLLSVTMSGGRDLDCEIGRASCRERVCQYW